MTNVGNYLCRLRNKNAAECLIISRNSSVLEVVVEVYDWVPTFQMIPVNFVKWLFCFDFIHCQSFEPISSPLGKKTTMFFSFNIGSNSNSTQRHADPRRNFPQPTQDRRIREFGKEIAILSAISKFTFINNISCVIFLIICCYFFALFSFETVQNCTILSSLVFFGRYAVKEGMFIKFRQWFTEVIVPTNEYRFMHTYCIRLLEWTELHPCTLVVIACFIFSLACNFRIFPIIFCLLIILWFSKAMNERERQMSDERPIVQATYTSSQGLNVGI